MSNNKIAHFDDFDYIVKLQKPQRICFGSGQSRNTAPIGKGLSPFQKRTAAEFFEKISPLTYEGYKYKSLSYKVQNKCHSTKGIGFLASSAPRFPKKSTFRTPSPSKYFPGSERKRIKESKAVFGNRVPRKFSYDTISPGPARNVCVKQCRRTRVAHNFGLPKVIQSVPIFCMPSATDVCQKCGKFCTGDYWKYEENYLCHECWFESTVFKDKYTKVLKKYKKIRDCSFMHSHEGTSAAIHLLPNNKIVTKLRVENYLDLYLSCI